MVPPPPGEESQTVVLPPGWQSYLSPQGRRYYVNTTTNDFQSLCPRGWGQNRRLKHALPPHVGHRSWVCPAHRPGGVATTILQLGIIAVLAAALGSGDGKSKDAFSAFRARSSNGVGGTQTPLSVTGLGVDI
ncbi:Growth arrest-specific protein 7 [Tupaia chinensis]|uniref:Growth arrest-specific protein 7 n=1 Tax=Tupaia chinensis TaxID=246437 RepID=L9JV59_TUPCH|nr:Growth arrest-specific protein 7 [Tupaia chinensis]